MKVVIKDMKEIERVIDVTLPYYYHEATKNAFIKIDTYGVIDTNEKHYYITRRIKVDPVEICYEIGTGAYDTLLLKEDCRSNYKEFNDIYNKMNDYVNSINPDKPH